MCLTNFLSENHESIILINHVSRTVFPSQASHLTHSTVIYGADLKLKFVLLVVCFKCRDFTFGERKYLLCLLYV